MQHGKSRANKTLVLYNVCRHLEIAHLNPRGKVYLRITVRAIDEQPAMFKPQMTYDQWKATHASIVTSVSF